MRKVRSVVAAAVAACAVVGCSATSVLDLEVGQCLGDTGGSTGEVSSVEVLDCAEPHRHEVFALPQLPDGEFPGLEAVGATGEELCFGEAFTGYVGLPATESTVSGTSLTPTAQSWADGDREIVCLLANADGSPLTGSLRDTGR